MSYGKRLLGWATLGLMCVLTVQAQSPLSKVVGTVRDSSGAVIPGVDISLSDESTGLQRETVTNEIGYYEIDLLPPGNYAVRAELPGFKRWVRLNIPLEHRQSLRIDIGLEAGEIQEEVTVTGAAPVVATETAEVNATTAGRKHFEYYLGHEESIASNTDSLTQGYSAAAIGWRAAGAASNQQVSRIEGLDTSVRGSNTTPTDFIDEVKFQYAGSKADSMGVVKTDLLLRSPTNDYHFKAQADLSNPALNSLGPNPAARRGTQTTDKIWYLTGSGPVIKDRTFVWFGALWFGSNIQALGRPSVFIPAPAWRNADFSQAPAALFKDKVALLRNPFTGEPFTNNTIPASLIWGGAKNFQQLYPQPNFGDKANPHATGLNWQKVPGALSGNRHGVRRWNTWNLKVDQHLTGQDMVGYTFLRTTTDGFFDQTEMETFAERQGPRKSDSHSVYWTRTFSPSILNEFRAGLGRSPEPRTLVEDTGDSLGFKAAIPMGGAQQLEWLGISWKPQGQSPASALSPVLICITGVWSPLCGRPAVNQRKAVEESRHVIDNFSLKRGSHSIKTGIEYGWWSRFNADENVYGSFSFDGRFTGLPYGDFLMGLPSSSSRNGLLGSTYARKSWWAGYVQDDWKVTPDVTVEAGLRFEYHPVVYELNGRMLSFDPARQVFIVPDQGLKAISPVWNRQRYPILSASEAGYPERLREYPQPLFYPRLGVAWRPFGRATSAVRGSIGFFSTPPTLAQALISTAPFALSESFQNTLTDGVFGFRMPFPFPQGTATAPGQSAFGVTPEFAMPWSTNWSLSLEQEILPDTGVRLSYIGAKLTQLPYQRRLDKPRPGPLPYRSNCASLPAGSCVGSLFPNFNSVTLAQSGGNQHSHMFEAEVHRRWARGLEFTVDFAWNKTIGDATDFGRGVGDRTGGSDFGPSIENPYDRARERGIHPRDVPFRFIFHHIWELPMGRGQRWINDNAFLDAVLGGWTLWGAWQWTSRVWITPIWSGVDASNTNTFSARPDLIPGCDPTIDNLTAAKTFKAECFAVPASGRFGTAGRSIFRGMDNGGLLSRSRFAIFKHFNLTPRGFLGGLLGEDGARLRVGIQMTNPTNTPWLATQGFVFGFTDTNNMTVNSPGITNGFYTANRQIRAQIQVEF